MTRTIFTILILTLVGCQTDSEPQNGRLRVICTTSLIADAAQRIGGPHVQVECLMGPGVDPHRYMPSAGDIDKLASAKLVLYHGLHLEGKMVDILATPRSGQSGVAVTAKIPSDKLRHADGEHDPHVWFDPTLWTLCVQQITDALCETDPAHATEFRAASQAFCQEIADADFQLQSQVKTLPEPQRILVTSHDAFGYFGARYGFQVRGLQGVSTSSETSTKDVSELAQFLGSHRVPAVFGETSVPSKGLSAVLDSVQKQYRHQVKLIGGDHSLYSDALGETGSPGQTYLGMIRHNMTVIVEALRTP